MSEHTLTIVIPALNEEEAIGQTIERCLEARRGIQDIAGLSDVELVVVSDGSTDRTAEIARQYEGVTVIEFPVNRGYGAAIKQGWHIGSGDLLGFLDADGTCDPRYFEDLCYLAITENADVVLGSRMGPDSKMPRLRRVGNRIYAFLLGFLCGRHVTDTASGMRVVRRSALADLYPLPDGLHFTPSMSARALLNNLRVLEVPMRYEERIGRSKLSVLRDGVRFLKTIFDSVLCYRPEKLFLLGFAVCVLLLALLAANPTEYYLQHRALQDWMIYRFVVCSLLASIAWLLVLATGLAHRAARLSRRRRDATPFWSAVVAGVLRGPVLLAVTGVLLMASFAYLRPGLAEWATTGAVTLHWSRLIAGAFCLFSAAQTVVFIVLMRVVEIWAAQRIDGDSRKTAPRAVVSALRAVHRSEADAPSAEVAT